jgi:hypothetical protein
MTDAATTDIDGGRWQWLPASLRPRADDAGGGRDRRLIEATILVLIGVLLTVATVRDVVRQTSVNHRLVADLATWRAYTGHNYHNLTTEQDLKGHTTREVVCGNTSPGAPKAHIQLCLVMTGPVVHGRRAARGGYYLPPRLVFDVRSARYGCFGTALGEDLCGARTRRAGPVARSAAARSRGTG